MVQRNRFFALALLTAAFCTRAAAQTITWTGAGDGTWSDASNWSPATAPASGDIILFTGTPASFTSDVNVSSDYHAVSFSGLTGDMTLDTSNASTITIDAMNTVSFAVSTNVTINVKIDGLGGLSMATSAQTGTVTLGAANVYFGATTLSFGTLADGITDAFSSESQLDVGPAGTLQVNFDEEIGGLFNGTGGGGSVTIANGATLQITQSSNFSGIISGAGGNLDIANGARFDVQGNDSYSGTTTIEAASFLAIDDGGSISAASTVSGNGTLEFDNTNPINFGSFITDQVNVLQAENGTTTLTNANDYSGTTTIDAGTLTDGVDSAFSPNSTILIGTGATLDVEHTETVKALGNDGGGNGTIFINTGAELVLTDDSLAVGSALTGTGTLSLAESGSLDLTGSAPNTFTGTISLEGGTLNFGDGSLAGATVNGFGILGFTNDAPITVGATLGTSPEDSFSLNATGTGKMTLLPPTTNQYTGSTLVENGILADGKDNSFSPNSVVSIDEGGTLEADFNETVAGLADGFNGGSEQVTIAAGKTLTVYITENSESQAFSGVIGGAGALKIDGDNSSIQELDGQNTYTGGTTIGNTEVDLSGGSINHPMANLVVADLPGDNGFLLLENGASVTNLNATIGNQNGSNGSVVINDAGSTWTNDGALTVGNAGNGDFQMNGGLAMDNSAVLGNMPGSFGLAQILGGTWTTASSLVVGNGGDGTIDLGQSGTININGGNGVLTLGAAQTGALLYIGGDISHSVDPNAGGILKASGVVGSSPTIGIDNIFFDVTGSDETPYYFTKTGTQMGTPVEIDGNIHVATEGAPVVLSSASSTYTGGTYIANGSELILGASSTGPADSPTSGPIGTGTLTFDDDALLDITQSNLTLANSIQLSTNGDSTNTFGNSSNPDNLALTGAISGNAQLEWIGEGTLTLSNNLSTFSGGVYVSRGSLNLTTSTIGGDQDDPPASGPAGIGTIRLDDGSTLTRPAGANLTILNQIQVANLDSQATIGGDQTGSLTLGSYISDDDATGRLNILSPVILTGVDEVERTFVEGTTLTVENDSGVASGILVAQSEGVINFTTNSPTVSTLVLDSSTANFTASSGGNPLLTGVSMATSTINFADNSNPLIEALSDSGGSVINLSGAGTNLILDNSEFGAPITFQGTIGGTGSVNIGGSEMGSVVELNGNNTYLGPTTIATGNVGVAGADFAFGGYIGTPGNLTLEPASGIVVKSGVTVTNPMIFLGDNNFVGGDGTLAPVSTPDITIQNSSVVAGGTGTLAAGYQAGLVTGNSIGTLTFASTTNVTFAQGGVLQFSIMNDTGTAGVDFSTINVNGTLIIDPSTAATHFVIQVVGIDATGPFDTMTTPASFDIYSPHTWTLLTAGAITNPGGVFDPSDFTIDTSTYLTGTPGLWSISEVGSSLDLNFTPVPEPSTWALIAGGACLVGFAGLRRSRARAGS